MNPKNMIRIISNAISIKNYKNYENEIAVLAIASQFQGRGIGTLLVQEGIRQLQGQPLMVKTELPRARKFYKKCGLVDIGTERRLFRKLWVLAYEHSVQRS